MWDGEFKKIARSIALNNFASTKTSIFLPGADCKCVFEALDKNVINKNSHLIFIERNNTTTELIRNKTTDFTNKILFKGEVEKYKINSAIDFAYLDFIGSMDEGIYNWVKNELVPNLHTNYRISFCFNYAWRPEIPFLKAKFNNYKNEKLTLYLTSSKYNCKGQYQIATYLALFKELFGDNFSYVCFDGKYYFKYQDNINSMVLYTLKSKEPKHDDKFLDLLKTYPIAIQNYDKRRGWKRKATLWSQKRSKETGIETNHFTNDLKDHLCKLGYDISCLQN